MTFLGDAFLFECPIKLEIDIKLASSRGFEMPMSQFRTGKWRNKTAVGSRRFRILVTRTSLEQLGEANTAPLKG